MTNNDRTVIEGEGEVIESAGVAEGPKTIAVRTESVAPVLFNPLDVEPVTFKKQLESRSQNYDALAMHLRSILVPGKDFGRIHIAKKGTAWGECEKPWDCSFEQHPKHWSDYRLLKPGADKILGVLGLACSYPDEDDYRRAALKGMKIEDVIIKAFIDNGRGQSISEGMGAASRAKHKGDLNNTLKKACKRARLDAVERLPAISALFEDDFLDQVARKAKQNNSTTSRQQQVNAKFNTGAKLRMWPLKGKLEGQKFEHMEDDTLDWILGHFQDKPDIFKAAERELERRANTQETVEGSAGEERPSQAVHGQAPPARAPNDLFDEYEHYPEAQ